MAKLSRIFRRLTPREARARGLTLMEVLMATSIMTIIMIAILLLYSEGQKYFINENIKADVIQESRYPLSWIARDIKEASAVVPNWGSYTTSVNTLVLRVPAVDANGLIIDVEAVFDYIIYQLNARRLERIIDAEDGVSARSDSSRIVAVNITSLGFAYYDSSETELTSQFDKTFSIKVSLTSRQQGLGRTFQETFSSKLKLRNKV